MPRLGSLGRWARSGSVIYVRGLAGPSLLFSIGIIHRFILLFTLGVHGLTHLRSILKDKVCYGILDQKRLHICNYLTGAKKEMYHESLFFFFSETCGTIHQSCQ